MANEIEQAVRDALQKARRNTNLLSKAAEGIYKVKNKPLLIMVDLNSQTRECSVTYTGPNGE